MKCIALKNFVVNHKAGMTNYEVAIGPVLREQAVTKVIKNRIDGKECWVCKSDLSKPFGKIEKSENKELGITVYFSALEYDDDSFWLFREWNEMTHNKFYHLYENTKGFVRKGDFNLLHPLSKELEQFAIA